MTQTLMVACFLGVVLNALGWFAIGFAVGCRSFRKPTFASVDPNTEKRLCAYIDECDRRSVQQAVRAVRDSTRNDPR